MGYAIPLGNIGIHVIDQIALVHDHFETPDGQARRPLRSAEISISFATADGLPITPATVVIGDEPLPTAEARRRLAALQRKVLVAQADVKASKVVARGSLVLRLLF
jgi:hypothetical protein